MSTTIRLSEEAGFEVEIAEGNLWNYTVRFRKIPETYRAVLRIACESGSGGVIAKDLYESSPKELGNHSFGV